MNCAQVDELLAAYALDAVDEDERAEIEEHLATCGRHAEVAALRATALALSSTVEEREPPPSLEARLLASIAPAAGAKEAPSEARPASPPPSSAGTQRERGRPAWLAPLAAALAVVVVGLGALVLLSPGETSPSIVHYYQADGTWMSAERAGEDAQVLVTMAGLAPRPGGEVYQVWAVRDGAWHSVGVCNTDEDSWWRGEFEFDLQPDDRLVLTVEPAGGSVRPTGEPLLGAPGPAGD